MAGTIVKCIYAFEAEVDSDLSLNLGDLIKVTKLVSDDWYEGTIDGKTGQFPKAFVEQTEQTFDVGIAISPFTGEQDGDLALKEGDFVVITEIIDDNWASGYTHGGNKGSFPRLFVKQISFEDSAMKNALQAVVPNFDEAAKCLQEDTLTSNTNSDEYIVISPFAAQGETELNLVTGVTVEVLGCFDDFWLEGKLGNGETGIFPKSCINFPEDIKLPIMDNDNTTESPKENITASFEEENPPDTLEYVVSTFDYNSSTEGDLCFQQGDRITLLEVIDDNWYRGGLGGLEGIFPANYVEKLVEGSTEITGNKASSDAKSKTSDNFGVIQDSPVEAEVPSDTNETMSDKKQEPVIESPPSKPNRKAPPSRPSIGPKRPAGSPKILQKKDSASEGQQGSTPSATSEETTEKSEKPRKKPPPERPKMPTIKKDTIPPFSYIFDTESQPTVIISGRYVKEGEPNMIVLRRTIEVS